MTVKRLFLLATGILVLGLTGTVATLWVHETTGDQTHTLRIQQALLNFVTPRTPQFTLTDHDGNSVKNQDFHGRLMLVYFGYTQCADICPFDLAAIGQALDTLNLQEDTLQPLFITIDPENDTRALLAQYVSLYHPRLRGLTGSHKQVKAAANSFGASFEKNLTPRFTGHGHSANLYLIGRDGEFLRAFRTPTTGEVITDVIRLYLPKTTTD
tara:strand:- start:847 stop:1482 length:636 start_codon:yes stop_codon:yes gene_type:complete